MPGHDIIVVGASAGGVEALSTLVSALPADLPAAVCIVLHIPPQATSMLPRILQRCTALTVVAARDHMRSEPGTIYVAPADHHMMVHTGHLRVMRGPRENRHRPAVDPLFRSAALAYGPRVVGVVLTGALDDGTAGLQAIKSAGGVAIVQDPDEAWYPSMPLSALENVRVDYRLPVAEIGAELARLAYEAVDPAPAGATPPQLELESRISEMDSAAMQGEARPGHPSPFSCPECKGVLWEIEDGALMRFRCRTGHAYGAESVLAEQSETLEAALWAALNTLEEHAVLSRRLRDRATDRGHAALAARFAEKVREAEQHMLVIRSVLLRGEPTVDTGATTAGA